MIAKVLAVDLVSLVNAQGAGGVAVDGDGDGDGEIVVDEQRPGVEQDVARRDPCADRRVP